MQKIRIEAAAMLIRKAAIYTQLVEAVKIEDKNIALDALIECAMSDVEVLRTTRMAKQLDLSSVMDVKKEAEFKNKLKEIFE